MRLPQPTLTRPARSCPCAVACSGYDRRDSERAILYARTKTACAPPPSRAAARAEAPSPLQPAHTPSPPARMRFVRARRPSASLPLGMSMSSAPLETLLIGTLRTASAYSAALPTRRARPSAVSLRAIPRSAPARCLQRSVRTSAAAPVIVGRVHVGVGREQRGDYLDVPCCCRRHKRRGAAAHTIRHKRDGVEQPTTARSSAHGRTRRCPSPRRWPSHR